MSSEIEKPQKMPASIHRILVVDDDDQIMTLTRRWLKRWGFEAESARNGVEATEKVERAEGNGCPFDLVISDVDMPQMNGIDLAGWLNEKHPNISVLMVSGLTTEREMFAVLRADFDHCGSKPVSMGDMRRYIDIIDTKRSFVQAPRKR